MVLLRRFIAGAGVCGKVKYQGRPANPNQLRDKLSISHIARNRRVAARNAGHAPATVSAQSGQVVPVLTVGSEDQGIHSLRYFRLTTSMLGSGNMKPVPRSSIAFSRRTNSSLKCQGNT